VWVQPRGNWGDGDLHLVELSAKYEGLDNVVAFWSPREKPEPLKPLRFGYTLSWQSGDADGKLSENHAVSTRIGADSRFVGAREFVIDFKGPKLDRIPDTETLEAIANCSTNAVIAESNVLPNPYLHSWRVILKMQPKPGSTGPVDLRCTLQKGTNILAETWTYLWSPP
jgi:glucans biosynthesis protein